MTPLETHGLGKRHHGRWALRDCTLAVREAEIIGVAGPNGAGKSTLLGLAVGLLQPDEGALQAPPVTDIGYVAQDAPLYRAFSVGEMLDFARSTNVRWDQELALSLLGSRSLETKVSALTPGERARLALALALGKRPHVVLLDEPFAGLDPLAGREFLKLLMDGVAETSATVVIASHVIADIERVCDHIVLLTGGGVRLEGNVEELLETHRVLMGPRRPLGTIRGVREIVRERHSGRQLTLLVAANGPIVDSSWTVDNFGLEELLLAYMAPERLPQAPSHRVGRLRWHG